MDPLISKASDHGSPYVLISPENNQAMNTFKDISEKLIKKVENIQDVLKKPKIHFQPKEGIISIQYGDKTKSVSPLHLRKKCICAGCVDEFTGNKLIKDKQIPEDVYPTKMEEKGNYAVAIVWSDGHRSSIYPYKRLLSNDIESI